MQIDNIDMGQRLLNMRYIAAVKKQNDQEQHMQNLRHEMDIYVIFQKQQLIIGFQSQKWTIHDMQLQDRADKAIDFVSQLFPCKINIIVYNIQDLQLNIKNKNIRQMFTISFDKFLAIGIESNRKIQQQQLHIFKFANDKISVLNLQDQQVKNIEELNINDLKERIKAQAIVTSFLEEFCLQDNKIINLQQIILQLQQLTFKTVQQNNNAESYLNNGCTIISNGQIITNKQLFLSNDVINLLLGIEECNNLDLIFTSQELFQDIVNKLITDIITYRFDFTLLNSLQKYFLTNNRIFVFEPIRDIIFPNDRSDNKTTDRLATPITINKIDTIRKSKLEQQQASDTSPITNDLCIKLLPKQPIRGINDISPQHLNEIGFQQLSPNSNHLAVSEINQSQDIDEKFKNLEHNYNKILNFKH